MIEHPKRGGEMPTLKVPDGEIYYEVHGSGYPLMIFAPGGLRSELAFWRHSPSNPSAPAVWMDPMAVLSSKFRVIAMDQRNAGRSRTGIDASDDWHTMPAIIWHWPTISASTGFTLWAAASARHF